jgi:ATP-binding cassette subfamily B protein
MSVVPLVEQRLSSGGGLTVSAHDRFVLDQWHETPTAVDANTARYERCGLLPLAWRLRETWLGPANTWIYTSSGALRSNQACLAALIGCAWVLALLVSAGLYWLEISAQRAAVTVTGEIREQIHRQAHRLGAGDLFVGQRTTAAELFTEKTEAVRLALVEWWRTVPHAALFALMMLVLAMAVDFWLSLVTLLLAGISLWLVNALRRRIRKRQAVLTDSARVTLSLLVEQLRQNRLLGNLTIENRAGRDSFDDDLQHYNHTLFAQESTSAPLAPLVAMFVLSAAAALVLLAGFNMLREPPRISLAGMVLLCSALMALAYPIVRMERLFEKLPAADKAVGEIFTYLDRQPRVGQMPAAATLERLGRQISLEHVTLADMTGRLLLDDISCSFPAGSPVVLFCTDDATAMALAGLLPRFCDPAAGQVLFDGRDLRLASIDSVRRQVALILTDHVLTSGTLAENIAGHDGRFTSDEIVAAAKQVHADALIQSLPEGLKTEVGPHGLALSTGDAISIALARVALYRPSVVVIEEPRDVLDQPTAERVADALDRVSEKCTLVIIARRLATLRAAQRILLFHEGRLLADGTHQELLQQNDLYRHLNYVRFNEFRGKFS